jgi:hypothetical protein
VGALPSALPIEEGGHKTRPYVARKILAKKNVFTALHYRGDWRFGSDGVAHRIRRVFPYY